MPARDSGHGAPREGDPHVVLAGTGEPLYQLVTRREYIETLDRLLDSIDLDMAVVNRLGKVIVWNRSMARTWGDKDSALGADIRDLVPPLNELYRGYRLGEALIEDVVGRGATIDVQRYPVRLPTGALELFDVKAYPLRGRGEAILGAVLVLTDVTERVRLEQQLVRHARTTSLAELGAQLAHEIRNPLNSLQLNVELIQEGLARERVDRAALSEVAAMVIEEARRLNGLVTHFLEFARPAAPKFALESPREAIETALRLLAEEAKRRSIAIDCQLPELPACNLDRHQFQQVIYNVALNAIQWSEPGGTVEVRAWVAPDHVRIRVADAGPGIPAEALDRLFDLFYSRREGGTGLGLSIANRIIEAHGGELVATNRDEGGAAFTIDLPRPDGP